MWLREGYSCGVTGIAIVGCAVAGDSDCAYSGWSTTANDNTSWDTTVDESAEWHTNADTTSVGDCY